MKNIYLVERFKEFDSIEKVALIIVFIMFIYTWTIVIYELIDTRKLNRGYIVDKSFLRMEERCGENLNNKKIKITVRNRYVTNYICDTDG